MIVRDIIERAREFSSSFGKYEIVIRFDGMDFLFSVFSFCKLSVEV